MTRPMLLVDFPYMRQDAPRPHPRLSTAQTDRVLSELAHECRLDNLKSLRRATVETKVEQWELFQQRRRIAEGHPW